MPWAWLRAGWLHMPPLSPERLLDGETNLFHTCAATGCRQGAAVGDLDQRLRTASTIHGVRTPTGMVECWRKSYRIYSSRYGAARLPGPNARKHRACGQCARSPSTHPAAGMRRSARQTAWPSRTCPKGCSRQGSGTPCFRHCRSRHALHLTRATATAAASRADRRRRMTAFEQPLMLLPHKCNCSGKPSAPEGQQRHPQRQHARVVPAVGQRHGGAQDTLAPACHVLRTWRGEQGSEDQAREQVGQAVSQPVARCWAGCACMVAHCGYPANAGERRQAGDMQWERWGKVQHEMQLCSAPKRHAL